MSENQTKRTRLVSKRQAGVIGGAAGVEIAVRGLDITIPSIIDTALAIVVVGLSSKMFPKTAEVAMWMFYLTLVFILLSNLFPQSLDRIRTDRPLLGLLAIGTIGTAIPANTIVAAVGETSQSPSESLTGQNYALISSFTVLILIFLCLSAYLFALRRDRYLADDWLLEAVYTPDKIRRIRRYRNRRNPFDYVFLGVAFGTLPLLLIQVVFFLSLFVVVVSGFYPIPEVAFVSTAVISAFGLPERTRLPAPNIEFESGLGRSLQAALISSKGGSTLGVVLLGIMLSLVIFVLGFTFTYDAVAGVKDAIDWVTSGMTAGISPLRIVIEAVSRLAPLGAVITLVVCAVALLLTWVQLSRRMPSYVKAWNGERKKTRQKPPLPATTTPPRTVLLPTGLSVIALVVILRFQFTPQWIPAIYGILWPVGLLVLAIWVHKTIQMKPQPAMTDHHVHISAAGMQSTGLILAGVLAGQPLVSSLPILLGTVLLIGGQLYYSPDVSRWCDETTGPLQYLDTLWILSFLIPLIVIGAVQYGSPWIGVLLSAIPVSFGGLKAIQRYRSTNQ